MGELSNWVLGYQNFLFAEWIALFFWPSASLQEMTWDTILDRKKYHTTLARESSHSSLVRRPNNFVTITVYRKTTGNNNYSYFSVCKPRIRKESRNVPNPLEKSFKIYSKTPAEPSFILSEFLSNRRLWSLKQRRKYRLSGGTMDPPPISLNSRHVGNLCGIQVSCFVHCSKHSNRNFLACVHRSSIWMLRPPLFVLFFPSGDAPSLFLISAKSSSYYSPTVYFIVSDYGDEATGSTIHSTVQRKMVDLVIGQLEEEESSSKLPLKLLAWGCYPTKFRLNIYSKAHVIGTIPSCLQGSEDMEIIMLSQFGRLFELHVARWHNPTKLTNSFLSRHLLTVRKQRIAEFFLMFFRSHFSWRHNSVTKVTELWCSGSSKDRWSWLRNQNQKSLIPISVVQETNWFWEYLGFVPSWDRWESQLYSRTRFRVYKKLLVLINKSRDHTTPSHRLYICENKTPKLNQKRNDKSSLSTNKRKTNNWSKT